MFGIQSVTSLFLSRSLIPSPSLFFSPKFLSPALFYCRFPPTATPAVYPPPNHPLYVLSLTLRYPWRWTWCAGCSCLGEKTAPPHWRPHLLLFMYVAFPLGNSTHTIQNSTIFWGTFLNCFIFSSATQRCFHSYNALCQWGPWGGWDGEEMDTYKRMRGGLVWVALFSFHTL